METWDLGKLKSVGSVIDVLADPDSAIFACKNPETVLQTDACVPKGMKCTAQRCAGPLQGARTPFLSKSPDLGFWNHFGLSSHLMADWEELGNLGSRKVGKHALVKKDCGHWIPRIPDKNSKRLAASLIWDPRGVSCDSSTLSE